MVLRIEKEANAIVGLFPFFTAGTQQTLTLRKVTVREGGLEAQITASWGDSEVVFFDSRFVVNRAWYEAGKEYAFTPRVRCCRTRSARPRLDGGR